MKHPGSAQVFAWLAEQEGFDNWKGNPPPNLLDWFQTIWFIRAGLMGNNRADFTAAACCTANLAWFKNLQTHRRLLDSKKGSSSDKVADFNDFVADLGLEMTLTSNLVTQEQGWRFTLPMPSTRCSNVAFFLRCTCLGWTDSLSPTAMTPAGTCSQSTKMNSAARSSTDL